MEALHHAANAVRHAEALADEAQDAGLERAATRLRTLGEHAAACIEEALKAEDEVPLAREARLHARSYLGAANKEASVMIEATLGTEAAAAYRPGAVLDIAERARFRVRRLREHDAGDDDEAARVESIVARLEHRLRVYDRSVDRYLEVSGSYATSKDRALRESQVLRKRLEEAKAQLLTRLEPGSEAARRVKARTVRTRRARWIDTATLVAPHPGLLFTSTDASAEAAVSLG